MLWWAIVLALGASPYLGTVIYVDTPVGVNCTAICYTDGNADGGSCRSFTVAKNKPSREVCKAELARQCSKAKPPPGGCHVGREGRP